MSDTDTVAGSCCSSAESVARVPLIGEIAPAFKAETTPGMINFPEDYKGKMGDSIQPSG